MDEPLIRAIVSDHSPEHLYLKTEEIREDLAMLQASVVPDPDASRYAAEADIEARSKIPSHVSSAMQSGSAAGQTEDVQSKTNPLPSMSPASADVDRPRSEHWPSGHAGAVVSDQEASQDDQEELNLPTTDVDYASDSDYESQPRQSLQESFGPVEFLREMFEHLYVSYILSATPKSHF